jgi:hypothetical protein
VEDTGSLSDLGLLASLVQTCVPASLGSADAQAAAQSVAGLNRCVFVGVGRERREGRGGGGSGERGKGARAVCAKMRGWACARTRAATAA